MSTQICRGFTDDQWRGLKKRLIKNDVIRDHAAAWDCAIRVFERRIRERFLSCIEALEEADSLAYVAVASDAPADCSMLPNDSGKSIVVPGFAIMALCSLLLETLQSFYPANLSSGELIKAFLRRPAFGQAFKDSKTATSFVKGIRNGILHDAETRRWVIWRDKPKDQICEHLPGGRYSLNRTAFYQALRKEFEAYLEELRGSRTKDLRTQFVKRMDEIVESC